MQNKHTVLHAHTHKKLLDCIFHALFEKAAGDKQTFVFIYFSYFSFSISTSSTSRFKYLYWPFYA